MTKKHLISARKSFISKTKCTRKRKCKKYSKKDRGSQLSQLPDEILVSVLSLLEIREAARTCVLSKRWEHLWSFNRLLNFNASEKLYLSSFPTVQAVRCNFIQWVNKVLESHRGTTIDEFRVCFWLDTSFTCAIDSWIEFALSKRVQRLELDLRVYCKVAEPYSFTNRIYNFIKTSPASISLLTSLSFKGLNIRGETLEYFLSSCPLLESLTVKSSEHLVSLKVVGPSLRLKLLVITSCSNLQDLEVCVTSLVSLTCVGMRQKTVLQIRDAFRLAEVSISNFVRPISHDLFMFSSYFSQLETLSLGVSLDGGAEDSGCLQLPEFSKLKHLTLRVTTYSKTKSLLGWTTLIHASPLLHKVKLQLDYKGHGREAEREMHDFSFCPHRCLKEVELAQFLGCLVEVEFAQYLMKNAVLLEKIIIDSPSDEKKYAKKGVRQLQECLPARVEMNVRV